MSAAANTQIKRGTRVIVTTDLPGAPEGTPGTAGRTVGLTWPRTRVVFDNGTELGAVGIADLVREPDWPQFQVDREKRRAEEAEAAAKKAVAPAAKAAGGDDAAGGNDRLAALMARSKKARAGKDGGDAAPAAAEEPAAEAAGGNDRLAALMARSKAARESKS